MECWTEKVESFEIQFLNMFAKPFLEIMLEMRLKHVVGKRSALAGGGVLNICPGPRALFL